MASCSSFTVSEKLGPNLGARASVWNEDVPLSASKPAESQSERDRQEKVGALVLGFLVCDIRTVPASWENLRKK